MYTLFATSPDRELDWQDEGVEGIERFLTRVYKFVRQNAKPQAADWHAPVPTQLSGSARRLERKLHQTIKRVSDDFQGRWHFNTCISAIMELVNEANRRMLGSEDARNPVTGELVKGDKIPLALLAEVQRDLVLLLAPFAPFIAEELWEMLGEQGSLLRAPWPKYDPALAKEEEIEIPVQVNGKLRSRIVVAADASDNLVRERALADEKIRAVVTGKQVVKVIVVSGKLVSIVLR
jgi:leucyl-tRNA synthetase